MGQQIVYCGKCGSSLRHDDFEKGKAAVVDAISYCSACLPASLPVRPPPRPESQRLSISSTKVRPVASPSPSTRRRTAGPGLALPFVLGGAAALVVVVVAALLLSGGRPPAAPPAPPRPAPDAGLLATWKRLEMAAASADPDELLVRIEEASKVLGGTEFDGRLRALEARTREMKKSRDAERQLALSLEDARKFMASELRFTRPEEFQRMLDRLLATPGGHSAEVRRMAETWGKQIKEREAPPPPPPVPVPPPPLADALALGSQGEILQWLVLGTFPNTDKQDGLYLDCLGTDGTHVPASGLEVRRKDGTRVSWMPERVPDGTVPFRRISGLGAGGSQAPAVAFAACWLVSESEAKVKFRVNADSGYRLRLNSEQVGNRPKGHELGTDPETHTVTLTRGLNLVVVKVGAIGSAFGLRVRVTTTAGLTEPAPGVAVALGGSPAGRILLKETFESGPGRFQDGELRADAGQNVLGVHAKGVYVDEPMPGPVGPSTQLRFRLKPPPGITHVCVLVWCNERKLNYWYHLKGLNPGAWASAVVPLKDMKGGYGMDGPALQGNVASAVRIYFDVPPGGSAGPLLIDDVELTD